MTARSGAVTTEITISLDGYSAGLNQTVEVRSAAATAGADKLHGWMAETPKGTPPKASG